jgi:uncharacterized damage-inducible protein DinB
MNILAKLLDHVAWADAKVYAAITALDVERPERSHAARIYSHVAAAEHIWHFRLEGRVPVHAVWPELSLDAAAALARESLAGLRAAAAADAGSLAREIEYRTSAGQAFRNTAADILSHVALHGSYHRGQIGLLTRQGGGTPVATDYVLYARG